MNNLNKLLQSIGLKQGESMVYLIAIRLGTSPVSTIAKRCNLPRSTTRYACDQLVKKQLMVETQKGSTKLFTAENPEKLRKLLDLQFEQIQIRSQNLDLALNDLKLAYNPHTKLPKVRFYEGVDGIIEMLNEVLSENQPKYGVSKITKTTHPQIREYLQNIFTPKSKKLNLLSYSLRNDNQESIDYSQKSNHSKKFTLYLPEKNFNFHASFNIYSNKVAFYSADEKDLTGVIIENDWIRQTQLALFKTAWNYARTLKINEKNLSEKLD